jgi:hypothetical protein
MLFLADAEGLQLSDPGADGRSGNLQDGYDLRGAKIAGPLPQPSTIVRLVVHRAAMRG